MIGKVRRSKVCIVAYTYYFTDARIKSYVNSLLEKGSLVDVIALREPGKSVGKEDHDRLRLYYLSGKYMGSSRIRYMISYVNFTVRAFFTLSYLWLRRSYTAIHVHNMPNLTVFSALLPRVFGSKVILDVHDLFSQIYLAKYTARDTIFKLILCEERISCAFARAIICADPFQADFLVERRHVNRRKLTIIMNFPDLTMFHGSSDGHEARESKHFKIVYHGSVTRRQGIDIILEAIRKIRDAVPVRFFIYGTGDYLEECRQIISLHNLQDIVFASGEFFRVEELPNLLADKNVGVIANRKTAAAQYMLPAKMLEYMALGIPVVAPALENLKYYFSDREILFYEPENPDDLADKIAYLYNHRDTRRKYSAQGCKYVRDKNFEHETMKYYTVIGIEGSSRN